MQGEVEDIEEGKEEKHINNHNNRKSDWKTN